MGVEWGWEVWEDVGRGYEVVVSCPGESWIFGSSPPCVHRQIYQCLPAGRCSGEVEVCVCVRDGDGDVCDGDVCK